MTSYLILQLHVGPSGVEAPFYRPRQASAINGLHAISMNANLIAPIVMSPIGYRACSHSALHLKVIHPLISVTASPALTARPCVEGVRSHLGQVAGFLLHVHMER